MCALVTFIYHLVVADTMGLRIEPFFDPNIPMTRQNIVDRTNAGMVHGDRWAVEADILVALGDSEFGFHQSFVDTLAQIRRSESRWKKYIKILKKVPSIPFLDKKLSPAIFKVASTVVWMHLDRLNISMQRTQELCVAYAVLEGFQLCVLDEEGNCPPEAELSQMGRDRSNWLPFEAVTDTQDIHIDSSFDEF